MLGEMSQKNGMLVRDPIEFKSVGMSFFFHVDIAISLKIDSLPLGDAMEGDVEFDSVEEITNTGHGSKWGTFDANWLMQEDSHASKMCMRLHKSRKHGSTLQVYHFSLFTLVENGLLEVSSNIDDLLVFYCHKVSFFDVFIHSEYGTVIVDGVGSSGKE